MTVDAMRRVLAAEESPPAVPSAGLPEQPELPAQPDGPSGEPWARLVAHVQSVYQVTDKGPRAVEVSVEFGGGCRRGAVIQWCTGAKGEEWVMIHAPVGRLENIDLVQLLTAVDGMVCGGVSVRGPYVSLRHAVPLACLDVPASEAWVGPLLDMADMLEQRFTAEDE